MNTDVFLEIVLAGTLISAMLAFVGNYLVRQIATSLKGVGGTPLLFSKSRSILRAKQVKATLIPIIDTEGTHGDPIPIHSQIISIGRDPNRADLVLADATVSKLHARIVKEDSGDFFLYDEGSTNGTYVNSTPIKYNPHKLKDGDIISFGRVSLIFTLNNEIVNETTEPLAVFAYWRNKTIYVHKLA